MRDVPLVPKCNILECRDNGRTDEPGEARHVLAEYWISFVRHGGGALLALGEELFGLQYLRALKMSYFGRQPFERARNDGQYRKEHGMTVARYDLGGDGLGPKA